MDRAKSRSEAPATGYLHPLYVRSLAEFGRPRHLSSSGGWILEREIPGSTRRDAMGPYPIFVCRDWSRLCPDLEAAASELVSLVLVTDPLAAPPSAELEYCFDDVRHFKTHFVVDLTQRADRHGSRHHRYYARRALRRGISVELCERPARFIDEWMRLYGVLVARHGLVGIKRFSRKSFEMQLSVPGAVMFRAVREGVAVGAHLWYLQGERAYSHLQATADAGYEMRAPYALYAEAIEWLTTRCSVAALGAGAGLPRAAQDGLADFKRGWATGSRDTHICTRVFDRRAYDELVYEAASEPSGYFPAYRAGELVH